MDEVGTPGPKRRILVADDHPLLRDALVQIISREADLCCGGQASNGAGTIQAVIKEQPDLVILDLRLPDGNGLDLIKTLKEQGRHLAVLVLTQFEESQYAERTLRAGALGYLMKAEAPDEILRAIRTVLQGQLYVSRKVTVCLLQQSLEKPAAQPWSDLSRLSDRQLRIFEMVGAGQSTREIAHALGLSAKTVDAHRENIKHRLGLPDATALQRHAVKWVEGQPGARPSL
jgi:DNA-binding NarL/FixJ family response regulator